jgi:hypothetical protein
MRPNVAFAVLSARPAGPRWREGSGFALDPQARRGIRCGPRKACHRDVEAAGIVALLRGEVRDRFKNDGREALRDCQPSGVEQRSPKLNQATLRAARGTISRRPFMLRVVLSPAAPLVSWAKAFPQRLVGPPASG